MSTNFDDCPCSGKNMSYFTAPWILLALCNHEGTHGYEIKKILKGYMEDLGISLNITGLYRHLKLMEERGVVSSEWDTPDKGPVKRQYYLTKRGKECLWQWMQTLHIQLELITRFFQKAGNVFPSSTLPRIQYQVHE
ncbi:MAG: helix-turn-helix transcriptional regulator [Deltaproteobacteria bacterium]|nr:helix-turn-helix transcriptional regulator [Deltaproteobacteria bacterium]